MKVEIEKLQREIAVHKDIEKQLAKRSHFCQKVILKLKQRVSELETAKKLNGGDENQEILSDDKMINELEQKLEYIERQYKETQVHYEQLNNDYSVLQDRLAQGREKYKRAALLMAEFLDDMISDKQNILADFEGEQVQGLIEQIRSMPIEQLEDEDKVQLVFLLIK